MNTTYGAYDPGAKGWRITHESIRYVIKPAIVNRVAIPYGARLYVFASGSVAEGELAGHAHSGVIGAHVLEEREGKQTLVASTKALPAGGYGRAPDQAKLMLFGPDHYYGWIYQDGYSGQGHTHSTNIVLLPRGKRVGVLAQVLAGIDNQGTKPCDEPATRVECVDLRFDLSIDRSAADVKVWPLVVRKSGIMAGRRIETRTVRVAFDTARWVYPVPKELSEGY